MAKEFIELSDESAALTELSNAEMHTVWHAGSRAEILSPTAHGLRSNLSTRTQLSREHTVMAKQTVIFTREHTVIQPASILEINGEPVPHTAREETRTRYTEGQRLDFGSKKAALAFCKCMEGAARLV